VLKTGEYVIIPNPGEHFICDNCISKDKCNEVYEMGMPIKMKNQVVGVIGFVCHDEKQRERIVNDFSVYFEFLKQISEMIAAEINEEVEKIQRVKMLNTLKSIIDKVDEGVIILNNKNQVTRMNLIAEKMLSKTFYKVNLMVAKIDKVESTVDGKEEFEMLLDNKKYQLLGKYYEMESEESFRIFIFMDKFTYKNNQLIYSSVKENFGLDKILGKSKKIIELKEKVKRIPSSSTVLITGESGTGKELFARAIHEMGMRKDKPFVALNCAAIPETLLESELFGYEKGAFTGADIKGKIGKIELADKGVLFLDEIGDMPIYLQAKLLRVLEERSVMKIGSNNSKNIDIQIISATNKNLYKMVSTGMFREDLFYRLNVIPVEIPSLRERKDDIKLLTMQFIEKYSKLFDKKLYKIENKVWEYFESYSWPGNVRELQNVVEYLVSMLEDEGVIKTSHLPDKIMHHNKDNKGERNLNLENIEKETIQKAILNAKENNKGNQYIANQLGIGIATLYRKMKKYNT
ncbi:MAG: sigma 54-interacting transcriptional regulator, partial [Clostridiales bacterium]|nr:sigma 54-interacting transcriptional regulator [Clostridiales bacterium]